MANCLVGIRSTVLFRIAVANFADGDVTLAKNEVLPPAVSALSEVCMVNVDPCKREAVEAAKVRLSQALEPDDAMAQFGARVPPSPAVRERLTAKDLSLNHLSNEDQRKVRSMVLEV